MSVKMNHHFKGNRKVTDYKCINVRHVDKTELL